MKICQDSAEANCVFSTSVFTITVGCPLAVGNAVTITNPSELVLTLDYNINGNRPELTTFGQFSTDNSECTVSSVAIYADQSKTAHTKLEIVNSGSYYTVQVANSADYNTAISYNFYMLATVGGLTENWIKLQTGAYGADVPLFTLIVEGSSIY